MGSKLTNGITDMSLDTPSKSTEHTLLLDSLPTEIQDLIFHYVVHDSFPSELKSFRQSNRYFRDRADIYLFHTLHISASNLSLQRVKHVAETERIAAHVRELVFHRGTFSGHKMVRFGRGPGLMARDYGDFEEYMVRGHAGFRPAQADLMRVSACYVAFAEEIEAETQFNREMSWQTSLRKHCARFPRLEKLTTLPDQLDLESSYLKRRCGLTHQSWTPNYFAPYEIFGPCGPLFRPRSLCLESVNGEDFAAIVTFIRGGEAAVRERFCELRELKLSFSETVGTLEVDGTYDLFIASCTNLRSLSLDFTSFYSPKILKDPESFPQKVIKLVLAQTYQKLADVHLTYPVMTEHDFVSFLTRHSSSLKTLALTRWPMPVTTNGDATGSIIRAFWKMGQISFAKLRPIELAGDFSNRKDGEGWFIPSASDREDRAEWSVPSTSNRWDSKEERSAYAVLEEYLNNHGSKSTGVLFGIVPELMEKAKTSEQLLELDAIPYKLGFVDNTFWWWQATGIDVCI